jgi:SP family arabinose:H+ symporter-like MFS transporter
MQEKMPETASKRSRAYVYLVAFIAAAGGFNWGYDVILMSGAILFMKSSFNIGGMNFVLFSHTFGAAWIEGFTMTSAIYGILVGMLVGGRLADRIGRKRTLILAAMLLIVAAIGTTVPKTLSVWNAFRIMGGIGGGLASLVSPMYISEIAPADRRGSLVTFNQLAIVLGAFMANLSTYVVAKYLGSNPECWRWMFGSACLPILVFLVGLFLIPESPRWLVMNRRAEDASAILTQVGGAENAERAIQEISQDLGREPGTYRELLQPGVRIALLVAVGLALFQQFVGVSPLIYYAPEIFVKAGISSNASAIGNTVILRVGDIVWTLFAIFGVDKFGRRPLLLVGTLGIALGQFLMGLCFSHHSSPLSLLLVFFLCEAAYGFSLAPLAWLISTELFPTRLRARGMSIAAFVMLGSGLMLAQIFPPLLEFFRRHFSSEAGAFWAYAVFCVAAFVFSFFVVVETKGKTLEQISASYAG